MKKSQKSALGAPRPKPDTRSQAGPLSSGALLSPRGGPSPSPRTSGSKNVETLGFHPGRRQVSCGGLAPADLRDLSVGCAEAARARGAPGSPSRRQSCSGLAAGWLTRGSPAGTGPGGRGGRKPHCSPTDGCPSPPKAWRQAPSRATLLSLCLYEEMVPRNEGC